VPPRYAYWTIIVDDQPTAFRAAALDDIMPTFNRLKEKQPTAKLMWFQSGKLWPSRIDAREAMQVRGERGRYSDPRQDGGGKTASRERPKWKSKDFSAGRPSPQALKPSSPGRGGKLEWKPKTSGEKPEWKPRRASTDPPAWKPKAPAGERPEWRPKGAAGDRPEWKPRDASSPKALRPLSPGQHAKPSSPQDPAKRKWVPKAEYKKLTGTEARRDDKWRPGGEHKDPRQKYKDAKKAKWGRFKQAIRSRAAKTKKS
jgi:hypothetical protein